jgi:hypothetical protein
MPSKHDRQRDAYDFLKSKADGTAFNLADVDAAAGWSPGTAYTYANKYYTDWMIRVGDLVRLKPSFRRVTFDDFVEQSSQVKGSSSKYRRETYTAIVVYEFLLPLRHETGLRKTLDDLFYKDTIHERLEVLGQTQIANTVAPLDGESSEGYRDRVTELVARCFTGYSISHVSGRFRAERLTTMNAAIGRRYLIDETTAVVRFIVPLPDDLSLPTVRGLFFDFFVDAVTEVAAGEDEIWLLERSPEGEFLHIWKKGKPRRR